MQYMEWHWHSKHAPFPALTSENVTVLPDHHGKSSEPDSSSFLRWRDPPRLPCAACSPGDHSAPSTSEPPSRSARSNGLGTPSRRYGCCSQPGRHNRNNTAFSFINILAGLHFLRSKMRCRPLNLAGGVIPVPKLPKYTSESLNC